MAKKKQRVCLVSKLPKGQKIVHGVLSPLIVDNVSVPVIYDPIENLVMVIDYGIDSAVAEKASDICSLFGVHL